MKCFLPRYHICVNLALIKLQGALQTFLGISLNVTYLQHSKNMYQELALKNQKNPVCICCT